MSDNTKLSDIQAAMKDALRAKDQARLGALRLILATVKQIEIDSRGTEGGGSVDEQQLIAILDKMVKQRRDAAKQYQDANRQDLAEKELFEIKVIEEFLPAQLSEEEVDSMIQRAISDSGATNMRDMGKVMGILKPQLQGRADMKAVSEKIKQQLQALG